MTIKLFVHSQKAANVAMNQTSLAIKHKNKHPNYTFWLFVLASVLIFIGIGFGLTDMAGVYWLQKRNKLNDVILENEESI